MDIIIIWVEIVIVCDVISHMMWETHLIAIHFILVLPLKVVTIVHIHLWLVVRTLCGVSHEILIHVWG